MSLLSTRLLFSHDIFSFYTSICASAYVYRLIICWKYKKKVTCYFQSVYLWTHKKKKEKCWNVKLVARLRSWITFPRHNMSRARTLLRPLFHCPLWCHFFFDSTFFLLSFFLWVISSSSLQESSFNELNYSTHTINLQSWKNIISSFLLFSFTLFFPRASASNFFSFTHWGMSTFFLHQKKYISIFSLLAWLFLKKNHKKTTKRARGGERRGKKTFFNLNITGRSPSQCIFL